MEIRLLLMIHLFLLFSPADLAPTEPGKEGWSPEGKVWQTEIENSQDTFPDYSTPFWATTDIPSFDINSGCMLDSSRRFYTCTSYNLKEVPKPLPDDLEYLLLQSTGITQIGDEAFAGSRIARIVVKGNRDLRRVDREAFANITGLQYLLIGDHKIQSWDYEGNFFNMFDGAEELVHLLLVDNNITFDRLATATSDTLILPNLEYLSLKSNPLRILSENIFSPLRLSPLKELNLQNCSIATIHQGAFLDLPYLEHVDFYLNSDLFTLSETSSFQSVLSSMPLTLNNLGLGHNYMPIVPTESLAEVRGSLWRLNLAENYFPTLGSYRGNGTFPVMEALKILILDSCNINTIHPHTFANLVSLELLSLMDNPLMEISPALLIPSLTSLAIQIDSFDDDKYLLFPPGLFKQRDMSSLKDLRLENALLRELTSDHFQGLDNLEILSLSNSKIQNFSEPAFEGLSSLKNLSLAFCETAVPLTWASLQGPRQLKVLDLTGSTFCLDSVYTDFYRCNVQIEILNLTKVLVKSERAHSLDFLSAFRFLKVLEIGGNKIRCWNQTLLSETSNLSTFKMANNGLEIQLTPAMISDFFNLTSLKLLDLSDNLFICNSQIARFYREVATHPNLEVVGYQNGSGYFCMDSSDNKVKSFLSYSDGSGLAPGWDNEKLTVVEGGLWQALLAAGLAISGMLVMVGLVYRHRWYIRFFYISHLKREVVRQEPFIYDAFVSYCEEQEAWVQNKLIPFLEQTDPPLRLCLHHRDFQVGKSITENIVDCMDSSRKFLVILSKSYLLSAWCMFEVHLAQHRLIQENRASLIVIKLGELPEKNIPKSVKYLLSSTTYLQMNPEDPCPFNSTLPSGGWQGAAAWSKLKVTLSEDSERYALDEKKY